MTDNESNMVKVFKFSSLPGFDGVNEDNDDDKLSNTEDASSIHDLPKHSGWYAHTL